MPNGSPPLFVRRGNVVKGPVTTAKILGLLKDGTLQRTDEVSPSPTGPWLVLANAIRQRGADISVVDAFTIKREMFGGGYVATYICPGCRDTLHSREEEWNQLETCPTCGKRFRLSPRAAAQVSEKRARQERERAAAAEEAQQKREHQEDARKANASANEESRRLQAEAARNREAALASQDAHLIAAAAAARRKAGACWYCGGPRINALPQCPSCRMVDLLQSA